MFEIITYGSVQAATQGMEDREKIGFKTVSASLRYEMLDHSLTSDIVVDVTYRKEKTG